MARRTAMVLINLIGLLVMLVALVLSLRVFEHDFLFTNTLSSIGERYRTWFLIMSIFLSLTLVNNLIQLYKKHHFTISIFNK